MNVLSPPQRLRLIAGLLALPAAAALSVVEPVVGWGMEFAEEPAARVAELAERPDDARVIAYTFLVSQLLFLVGALALMSTIRGRGAALATTGAVLTVLGAFGHIVLGGANLVAIEMGATGADAGQMAALYARAYDGPVMPFMMVGLLGFFLGLALLLGAAWRAGASRWAVGLAGTALVAEFALGGFEWGALVARLLLTAALAALVLPAMRGAPTAWPDASSA